MAQRSNSRIDRFAQMSKQEELIAKKRQEILEKQRTAELAKKVAAQMLAVKVASGLDENSFSTENEEKSDEEIKKTETETNLGGKVQANTSLTSKTGKISFGVKRATVTAPSTEQPPSKIQNSFCNDGSFLENFKKILEKQQQQQQKQQQPPQSLLQVSGIDDSIKTEEEVDASEGEMQHVPEPMVEATTPPISEKSSITLQQHQQHHVQEQQQHQQQQHQRQMQQQAPTLIPPPPAPPATVSFAFNAALMAPQNQILITQPVTDPNVAAAAAAYFGVGTTAAPPPPPTPTTIAAMLMPMHAVSTAAAPPPPPPPQLPMALATLTPLYMIPAPEPLQLNAIPQPKEFDLNAIPKPQLNLEVIQVPAVANEQPSSTVMEIAYVQEENQQQQQQIQIIAEESELQRQQLSPLQLQINNNEQEQEQQQHQQQQHPQPQTNNSSNINLQQQQQQQEQEQPQQLLPAHQVLSDDIYTNNNNNNNNNNSTTITTTVTTTNDDNTDGILTQMPTTLENLIDLVADNGDAYEETLRGHKNILHPAMWFICDKDSEAYHHYRQQVIDRRREKLKEQQRQEQAERELEKHIPRRHPCSMEEDKYDPESVISADNDSDDEYRRGMMDRNRDNIKRRIECRNELSEEERQEREAEEREAQRRQEKKKLRKSRWGGKVAEATAAVAGAATVSAGSALTSNTSPSSSVQSSFANQNKPLLTAVTRNDPALLQYAKLNYGSINLSEEDWEKCEEHYKVNLLYQDMMRKRQEIDRLARSGKFKYEYDSDEDVSGGTWEHKLRDAEMEATKAWATALTKQSEGKHHIGDFLPPEELKKFMEQYEAKKNNRQPDLSDYKEYKLKEDNKGFQMLQKLGWKEGQGLGQDGEGIVDPINKGTQREGNQGLGVQNAATPDDCDNEYDAYRKRMMLAYRFRPNPLNNPRRAYY